MELAPLTEALPLLKEIAQVLESESFRKTSSQHMALKIMRENFRTRLFHLNFVFEISTENYPYLPPFEKPFPFRPTLEFIEDIANFFSLEELAPQASALTEKISDFLSLHASSQPEHVLTSILPTCFSKREIIQKPVDSYLEMSKRLREFGELASFPEFKEPIEGLVDFFNSADCTSSQKHSPPLEKLCDGARERLEELQKGFPYRKSILAIIHALTVVDIIERIRYGDSTNWHEVEISWHHGDQPKLLSLYHFNRYQYQLHGLLADPEVVVLPVFGDLSNEHIIRLRAAPLAIFGVTTKTLRADRHFNTPLDFAYHDINHARRMWGYDQRKLEKLSARDHLEKVKIFRQQNEFIERLLNATEPNSIDFSENEIRKLVRVLIFETLHETALSPDPESFAQDVSRFPGKTQPFEVQMQVPISDLEAIRSFDGNLKSGANQLALRPEHPTVIKYFFDRAPGYFANVDNKLRWGFYDSVFDINDELSSLKSRIPATLADAAVRLFELLGLSVMPRQKLIAEISDRTGQPELYNYFSCKDRNMILLSKLNALNIVAGDEVHANWRRSSLYQERWKPADAKLADGTIVNDEQILKHYLLEQKIPDYLHDRFKIDRDPVTGEKILFEDIVNLPNFYLAPNHKNENIMSGAAALSAVDRIWQNQIRFQNLDQVERWLASACQFAHQAVLDRNANGARNNPVYNRRWMDLPPQNKKNDLDLVRIAFQSRLELTHQSLPFDQITLIEEGIYRLYRKILLGLPLRGLK